MVVVQETKDRAFRQTRQNYTQLSGELRNERSSRIANHHKGNEQRCALFYGTVRPPRGWDRIFSIGLGSSTSKFEVIARLIWCTCVLLLLLDLDLPRREPRAAAPPIISAAPWRWNSRHGRRATHELRRCSRSEGRSSPASRAHARARCWFSWS